MDPRLRSAVDASVGWYDDRCALHGVGSALVDGLWRALSAPPPLHSDVVVVEPAVTADRVVEHLGGREHCGVKDSFAELDLSGHGMELLFSATWMFRDADRRSPGVPAGWAAVTTADDLAAWTGLHDTRDVLLPPLLERAHFRILARYADDRIVAGAVARLGSGIVDVSNVYVVPGHHLDWAELAAAVGAIFPGRPFVGYERGDALDAARDGGSSPPATCGCGRAGTVREPPSNTARPAPPAHRRRPPLVRRRCARGGSGQRWNCHQFTLSR